ncbi:hypothetical protein BDEG_22378 [Batrachochytrium dendrobatidis JEL423]|nr:hypothetical protein BDEG_22378 [Batrachochytrium dendrobatidis JEL423]
MDTHIGCNSCEMMEQITAFPRLTRRNIQYDDCDSLINSSRNNDAAECYSPDGMYYEAGISDDINNSYPDSPKSQASCNTIYQPGNDSLHLGENDANKDLAASFITIGMPSDKMANTPAIKTCDGKPFVTKPSKLAHYDGLRGMAALWVFFWHYLKDRSPSLFGLLFGYQNWNASVPIFFILSGRVLVVSALKSGSQRQLVSAIIRRPFRLLMPLIILMIIDNLVIHDRQPVNSLYELIVEPIWFMFGSANNLKTVTGDAWTLSYEYIFSNVIYYTAFVLLQFQHNDHTRYLILGASFVWYYLTHSWGMHFIAGLILADLAQHGYIEKYKSWGFSSYLTSALFFGTMALVFRNPWYDIADKIDATIRAYQFSNGNMGVGNAFWEPNALIFSFSFAAMIAVETSSYLQWFFSQSVFRFLGRISFPMYLIHHYTFPMLDIFNDHVKQRFNDSLLTSILIVVPPTLFICFLSYLLIFIMDNPSVSIGKWIEQLVFGENLSVLAFMTWMLDIARRAKLSISQKQLSIRGIIMRIYHGKEYKHLDSC